jgi:hypothetical protein
MKKYIVLVAILLITVLGRCKYDSFVDKKSGTVIERVYRGAFGDIGRININGTWYLFNTAGGIIPEVKE